MDVRLVKHVLGRNKTYSSMKEVGSLCYASLRELGVQAKCPDEWVCEPKAKSHEARAKRGIVELAVSGPSASVIEQSLKERNIVKGALCIHIENKHEYILDEVSA